MSTMSIFDLTDTWNSAGTTFNAIKMNVTDTASAAGSLLLDLQVGGTSQFSVRKTGSVVLAANAFMQFGSHVGINYNATGQITLHSTTGVLNWGSSGLNSPDLFVTRDAADTLALRRDTNPQAFRVYNTFTDASNFERGSVGWAGNAFVIATENAGTGSNRPFLLQGRGNATVESVLGSVFIRTGSANRWSVDPNGHFLAAVDNTHDIGASSANRPRNVFWAGYQEMSEMTAPAAPAANGVRIYAIDNGSGKTQLMALFATGAAVQIAIEP